MRKAPARAPQGVLVIHETEPASYGWATVKNSNTNAMFDIVRQNPAPSIRRSRAGSSATSPRSCSPLPAPASKP